MIDSIFVQIASYRDPECRWTVHDLFKKAKHPERVVIGICNQVDFEKDRELFGYACPFPDQVREVLVPAMESQGVCWARHQAQKLYRGEQYVLMIDSHTRFTQDWDTLLIDELNLCPSEKAICSHYPAGYTPPDHVMATDRAIVMVALPFNGLGDLRFTSRLLRTSTAKPLRGAFIAACFLFAKGPIIKEVPYDPHMYFDEEEITLSARLFTRGWDVFSPRRNLIYHLYAPVAELRNRRLQWEDNKDWLKMARLGRRRREALFCGEHDEGGEHLLDLDQYGLGQVRTLKAFEELVGIDFAAKKTSERALEGKFIEDIERYA